MAVSAFSKVGDIDDDDEPWMGQPMEVVFVVSSFIGFCFGGVVVPLIFPKVP